VFELPARGLGDPDTADYHAALLKAVVCLGPPAEYLFRLIIVNAFVLGFVLRKSNQELLNATSGAVAACCRPSGNMWLS
jgi:hypothetical protein